MEKISQEVLTETEALLKKRFNKDAPSTKVQSNARPSQGSERVEQLVLPDGERGRMPLTQDKYLVKENPHLVAWERETRKFLRQLSPNHGHRVSAVMVYEWATGINVVDLMAGGGSANAELRKINKILKFYFGRSYMTHIAGRKVPNCYKVKPGYYIKYHRPMTLTLYSEYIAKTLNP